MGCPLIAWFRAWFRPSNQMSETWRRQQDQVGNLVEFHGVTWRWPYTGWDKGLGGDGTP